MNEMMVSNKEIISLKEKAHELEKTIKNHVCTIVISKRRKDIKYAPYIHDNRPNLEWEAN